MVVELQDLIWRVGCVPCESIELVGAEKEFGWIVVNDHIRIGLYIYNEVQIMNELEKFMIWNVQRHWEAS